MMYSKNTIAIPPGATIHEQLKNREMTQKEFSLRMGLSEKHISHLINGQVELAQDVALRLETVLGVPAGFWNNLETIYREKLKRAIAEQELEGEAELASAFPYAKMAALGWVQAAKKTEDKVLNLRKFFEVAKLDLLDKLRIPGIAFRTTGSSALSDYSLAAWAQKARIEARKCRTAAINILKLEEEIPQIRLMTTMNPDVFCNKLIAIFADCGAALVFLPHIGGSFLHGASFYDGSHIVVGLTVRGRDVDKFWFSLFHEMCHIIKGHIVCNYTDIEQENEANEFAGDILIPRVQYDEFLNKRFFTKDSIISFSGQIGVLPGIVLGRLQKEKYVPYNRHNDLKTRYYLV